MESRVLALAALGASVVALAVDSRTPSTVALVSVALIPWALVAAGVRLPLWGFFTATVGAAALVVVTADAGAPVFFGMFAVTHVASSTGRAAPVAVAVVAAITLPLLFVVNTPEGPAGRAAYFTIGIGSCALVGILLHHDRRLAAQLKASQHRLRDASAAEERRRIARDVHDALAHSLTAVVVNVAGARRALTTQPELALEALQRAEQVGRDSLDTVRTIVGLLRPEDGAVLGPGAAAGPSGLLAVVTAQREAGAEISTTMTGDVAGIDPKIGSALVRIAQEALTNAARHAPGAPIAIDVQADGDLVLDVSNGPPVERPLDVEWGRRGLGLTSIRERVRALGGTVEAGPTPQGGWRVHCTIPARPVRDSMAASP